MAQPVDHIHISEREADGTWEDCTWDSGLEWYRDCIDPRVPATHAEAQLLRRASGEPATGGSNLGDLKRGIKVRYGKDTPALVSNKTILAALKPGYASVLQGSMSAFGPDHRLSKFDRNFDGAHAVYLARTPKGNLLWCDPEAPTAADVPVLVTEAEVTKFVNAFAGQAIIAKVRAWTGATTEDTVDLKTYLPGYTANITPQSNVRSQPRIGATLLHSTGLTKTPAVVIGTTTGDVDPGNGSNIWYALWHENRVEYTAKDNITDLKPPAATDDGFTQATQAAAVAKAKTEATAAEKERIAKAAGAAAEAAIRAT